jgi:cell division topological specificity factor
VVAQSGRKFSIGAFLGKLFKKEDSKSVAKSRLHFVLVQDRTGLGNDELGKFKEELLGVIKKYFVIDESGFDVAYKRDGETTSLFINSPIIVRRQDAPGFQAGAKRHNNRSSDNRATDTENLSQAATSAQQEVANSRS